MQEIKMNSYKKKLSIIVITILLLCNIINAQTWKEIGINLPNGDTALSNTKITFTNKNIGWLYTEYDRGEIRYNKLYRSTDGGINWMPMKSINIVGYARPLLFSMEPDFFYMTLSGKASYTYDGGITWTDVNLSNNYDFLKIYFIDNQNGIAGGGGYSWITIDGGKKWNRKSELSWPRNFYFLDHKIGWAVGYSPFSTDAGYIAKTIDGGISWIYKDRTFGGQVDYFGVEFVDSLKGFAVGGSVSKTTDGGNNWQGISGVYGCDIGFLDDRNGWVSGYGQIYKTTDGGETWEKQLDSIISYRLINLIILKKDKVAYILGVSPQNRNATLLRADLSNISSVEENNETIPSEFYLSQNYPNPFNPTTGIEYKLSRQEMVTINVYNILGEEVATLVNEEKLAGTYEVEFNGGDLSSGVYIYRFQAGNFSDVKKFILLK
jgi:photosystem II stability/assembly factor-like uncharacterized protein